jgi:uncharacterized iron-regulated membrane protein
MITILIFRSKDSFHMANGFSSKAVKEALRIVHLWTGLVFGFILVILGLTGTAIAWYDELDAALNPTLLHAPPPPGMAAGAPLRLDPAEIQQVFERLEMDPAYGRPTQLTLPAAAGEVVVALYRPAVKTESPWRNDVTRQVMVDPMTLQVTGERNYGEFGVSGPLLMPTLFHLHRYLLAGENGKWTVAVAGVSALITCLTGLVLWWPRLTWRALVQSVSVRYGGNWPRFNFQLHRSAGFFALPVLVMLSFSGVYFNKPDWVTPAVAAVSEWKPRVPAKNLSATGEPVALADALLAAQARFPEGRLSRVAVPAKPSQPWEVRLRQEGEVRKGPGATRVSVDARSGAVVRVIDPLRARGGEAFLNWMFPLHSGEAFGLAGRVFISVFGLAPLLFFVTGLVVWLKIRRQPKKVKARPAALPVQAPARARA